MLITSSPQHRDLKLDELRCLAQLRVALRADGLRLVAQPIVELATGRVVAHELLVRMLGSDWSLVGPDYFLTAAERSGLIVEVDRWVLGGAAQLAAAGHALHVNLSARSVGTPGLVDEIERTLDRAGADPAKLTLEITETAATEDLQAAIAFADRFSGLGGRIALDDFGAGFGGLVHLKYLPVDLLKIDIAFVHDVASNWRSRALVASVAELAESLALRTVAEGAQDDAACELLRELGVQCVQGFHVGRAVPVAELGGPD